MTEKHSQQKYKWWNENKMRTEWFTCLKMHNSLENQPKQLEEDFNLEIWKIQAQWGRDALQLSGNKSASQNFSDLHSLRDSWRLQEKTPDMFTHKVSSKQTVIHRLNVQCYALYFTLSECLTFLSWQSGGVASCKHNNEAHVTLQTHWSSSLAR